MNNETLRILWLNWRDITNPAAGGAELYTHQVAVRLAQRGHEVTLLTSKYPRCLEREDKEGVDIVRRGNNSTVYLEAPRFFRSKRKKGIRYDIIVDAVNTIPFLSPLYVRNAPIVALLYQMTGGIFLKEFVPPIGHLFYALEKRSYIPWWLRRAERVVTLSNSNKAEIIETCPDVTPEKISVIPPGVDHDNFRPGSKSDHPTILFMNRLVRYKQPEHLVLAMKEVCHHVADTELILVGTLATVEYAAKLRRLIERLGLEETITLLLSKPFDMSKVSLFQRAWIHVLPSMKEGFGLSILEAAACGTPTVGYDVPGVRDAIVQGKTGLLARPGDTSSFAAHLTDLLSNAERLRSLGDQATKWAASFRWDTAAGQFLDVMKNS